MKEGDTRGLQQFSKQIDVCDYKWRIKKNFGKKWVTMFIATIRLLYRKKRLIEKLSVATGGRSPPRPLPHFTFDDF